VYIGIALNQQPQLDRNTKKDIALRVIPTFSGGEWKKRAGYSGLDQFFVMGMKMEAGPSEYCMQSLKPVLLRCSIPWPASISPRLAIQCSETRKE
jgi:hypothetical protein